MNNFTFNGQRKEYIKITERGKQYWTNRAVNILTVPGVPGGYVNGVTTEVRNIPISIRVEADSPEQLELRAEELADWLTTDEPKELIFDSNPNRKYYAMVDGGMDAEEIVSFSVATFNFICPDPFKYGAYRELLFPSDYVSVTNNGNESTPPIFEMEVMAPITFAMIQNNENNEYMMIGEPEETDVEVVDAETEVLREEGDTLDTWSAQPVNVDPMITNVAGTMTYDGTGIIATDYGTGEKWHGPVATKEITPIQDFMVEVNIDTRTDRYTERLRAEIYMLDENMNMIGKMGVTDNATQTHNRRGLARVGEYVDWETRYMINSTNFDYYNTFGASSLFFIRFKREGNRFTAYISVIEQGVHRYTLTNSFTDTTGQYLGLLRYIEIHLSNFGTGDEPYLNRINNISVYELHSVTEDQTPYIARAGDTITFNHQTHEILINGENRKDIKNFGAKYFHLLPGDNLLTVVPENSLDTEVNFTERYK